MALQTIKEKYKNLVRRNKHDLGDLFDYLEGRENNLGIRDNALGGNIQFSTPADYTKTDETDEDIDLEIQDTDGNVLDFFDGDLAVSVSSTTAGDGTAALAGSSPITFSNGTATVTVQLSGTWATGDTFTVTIDEQSVLGYTIASDSVQVTLDLS